jgi:hypothetical protein
MPFAGLKLEYPRSHQPHLTNFLGECGHFRSIANWQSSEDWGNGKANARDFAADYGWAAIKWPSGNLTIYLANTDGDMARLRYVA